LPETSVECGTASVVAARQLTRYYGRRLGVDAVDLDISEGEIFGFLGPNGSGKTTTIRLLLGFLRPTSGRASILGWDCWRQSAALKREVGYLPGDLRLYPWMTARGALRIAGAIRGIDLTAAGRDLSDRFELEMDLRVRTMSRGTRQKLGLVLAMAHKPRLLILDEPTNGLDPLMQDTLATCLRELASAGHTILFSSHTLSEVELLCDRIAVVRSGRIVANEPLETLRNRARRTVKLLFTNEHAAARTDVPHFLTRVSCAGRTWACELDGPSQPLVRWAAQQPLEDLEIGPPDLESLFRKFYRSPEGGA